MKKTTVFENAYLFCISVLFSITWIWHFDNAINNTSPVLFGYRDQGFFDTWSIQHFLSGILIWTLLSKTKKIPGNPFHHILLVALTWEFIELSMELGHWGHAIASWKNGMEHWCNRFIADPTLVCCGALLARKKPNAWLVAVIFTSLWLVLNITSSDSMYIQRLLFDHRF